MNRAVESPMLVVSHAYHDLPSKHWEAMCAAVQENSSDNVRRWEKRIGVTRWRRAILIAIEHQNYRMTEKGL